VRLTALLAIRSTVLSGHVSAVAQPKVDLTKGVSPAQWQIIGLTGFRRETILPQFSRMARKLRVEYPGAVYHGMNRGDRQEADFSG
jgi:hypothetical protein